MIDVLLPFYGDADHMSAAVQSVLSQDVDDWVLHVLDDAHPDASVCDRVAQIGDPRIVVERAVERLGVNGAFRRCLDTGTSDLLTFMGCDDVMRPDHLRTCLAVAERHPSAVLIQPGVEIIDGSGRAFRPLGDRVKGAIRPRGGRVLEGEALLTSLLHGNWLYFPSVVWRRSVIQGRSFRPDLETALDLQLVVDLLLDGEVLALDDHVTFDYRRHASSASARTARSTERFVEVEQVLRETARRCEARGWHDAARAARWRVTTRLHVSLTAAAALGRGEARGAVELARLATARG